MTKSLHLGLLALRVISLGAALAFGVTGAVPVGTAETIASNGLGTRVVHVPIESWSELELCDLLPIAGFSDGWTLVAERGRAVFVPEGDRGSDAELPVVSGAPDILEVILPGGSLSEHGLWQNTGVATWISYPLDSSIETVTLPAFASGQIFSLPATQRAASGGANAFDYVLHSVEGRSAYASSNDADLRQIMFNGAEAIVAYENRDTANLTVLLFSGRDMFERFDIPVPAVSILPIYDFSWTPGERHVALRQRFSWIDVHKDEADVIRFEDRRALELEENLFTFTPDGPRLARLNPISGSVAALQRSVAEVRLTVGGITRSESCSRRFWGVYSNPSFPAAISMVYGPEERLNVNGLMFMFRGGPFGNFTREDGRRLIDRYTSEGLIVVDVQYSGRSGFGVENARRLAVGGIASIQADAAALDPIVSEAAAKNWPIYVAAYSFGGVPAATFLARSSPAVTRAYFIFPLVGTPSRSDLGPEAAQYQSLLLSRVVGSADCNVSDISVWCGMEERFVAATQVMGNRLGVWSSQDDYRTFNAVLCSALNSPVWEASAAFGHNTLGSTFDAADAFLFQSRTDQLAVIAC